MRFLKENWNGILTCVIEVIVGVLLLIKPVGFTSAIIIAAGIILLISGVADLVQYFRTDAVKAAIGQRLAKGLLKIIAGLFCVLNYDWFMITFPVLTILYGVANLVSGLFKAQFTVDAIRLRAGWGWLALSAGITLVLAAVILLNPFGTTAALWTFTAVTLIVEAVLDLVALILCNRKKTDRTVR